MTIKYKASQQRWMKLSFLFLTLTFISHSHAQIVTGENGDVDNKEEKDEKVKAPREKINRDSLSGTTYYVTGMFLRGHRSFADESIAQSYGEWAEHTADNSGGGTFGVHLPISNAFSLDLGFTFFGHKEQYNYNDPTSDSAFFYSNTYMYIGVPVKLRYTVGDKFQFFAFGGLTPLNAINIRYNQRYDKADGGSVTADTQVIKDAKLGIFNLMATGGLGITYNFDWVGITIMPEYRHHLFDTYDTQVPVKHKQYSFALNAGFTLRF